MSSVLIVLLIFYYMFAISGMQLFADTKYGLELNAKSNFDNFGESMLTLLKVSTGEYVGLLRDCSVRAPACITGQDCGSRFAWIYFSVFLIFTSYITFQLFLAVVIDSFAWAYSLEDSGQVRAVLAALALLYESEGGRWSTLSALRMSRSSSLSSSNTTSGTQAL